ncbi:MAG: hypothetical protein WBI07_01280 [Mobilitalea sp.]
MVKNIIKALIRARSFGSMFSWSKASLRGITRALATAVTKT